MRIQQLIIRTSLSYLIQRKAAKTPRRKGSPKEERAVRFCQTGVHDRAVEVRKRLLKHSPVGDKGSPRLESRGYHAKSLGDLPETRDAPLNPATGFSRSPAKRS